MTPSPILITAADEKFFALAQGCIQSIRERPEGRQVALAFLDVGCTDEQRDWLRSRVDFLTTPQWEFDFPGREGAPGYLRALLARPFLKRYFPSHDVYVWIDADAWVHDWRAVELLLRGARRRRGLAIVPELDRGYHLLYGHLPQVWENFERAYAAVYDRELAQQLRSFPMLNAGVFALHEDAPHWPVWELCLSVALRRSCSILTDQLALNLAVYGQGLFPRTELLPAWVNWTCHAGLPAWDEAVGGLVEPYLPHPPIGILHLTGPKDPADPRSNQYRLSTTASEKTCAVCLRYPSQPVTESAAPPPPEVEVDYVSPGLEVVRADRYFPNLRVGNKELCRWTHLRRQIPHRWYVDRREPLTGFLNRDEAHILYNTALRFRGRPALEIGCWLGWSACHLALGGVRLDVIDPVLSQTVFYARVADSLRAAGVLEAVQLVPGCSPDQVHALAAAGRGPWSLIFIDGGHEGRQPLDDAIACERYAAEDALILFHDLASPEVGAGLDYLRQRGWRTKVYQTMQIMGVAWRGDVQPVEHFPDPGILWPQPDHLRQYPVSGWQWDAPAEQVAQEFASLRAVVQPFTLLNERRLASLYTLARHVCASDLPGNFVECGTARGGAAALLAYVIKHHSRTPRRLFCCDTFAGMPEPTAVDRHAGLPANLTEFGDGTLCSPLVENLEEICRRLDVREYVTPVPGLFADTLPRTRAEVGAISLLSADADWYNSTRDIFDNLYDRVVSGGFIQIDDYGYWEGCQKAVHDFERQRGLTFMLHPIDNTGVWLRNT